MRMIGYGKSVEEQKQAIVEAAVASGLIEHHDRYIFLDPGVRIPRTIAEFGKDDDVESAPRDPALAIQPAKRLENWATEAKDTLLETKRGRSAGTIGGSSSKAMVIVEGMESPGKSCVPPSTRARPGRSICVPISIV